MDKNLILVDENDKQIGVDSKFNVHKRCKLHRAFSIFIFNTESKKMLLQRRARKKYHSGGLWSNACCSHPIENETLEDTINKRLKSELGFDLRSKIMNAENYKTFSHDYGEDIFYCGKFKYCSQLGDVFENEIDYVFVYIMKEDDNDNLEKVFSINKEEVEEIKWVYMKNINKWLNTNPEDFTIWFEPAYKIVTEFLKDN